MDLHFFRKLVRRWLLLAAADCWHVAPVSSGKNIFRWFKPSRPKTRCLASATKLSVLKGILKDNGLFSIAAGTPESGSSREVPRGQIRWSEILAEGLDGEKTRGPVRWPEIFAEGLDCKILPFSIKILSFYLFSFHFQFFFHFVFN